MQWAPNGVQLRIDCGRCKRFALCSFLHPFINVDLKRHVWTLMVTLSCLLILKVTTNLVIILPRLSNHLLLIILILSMAILIPRLSKHLLRDTCLVVSKLDEKFPECSKKCFLFVASCCADCRWPHSLCNGGLMNAVMTSLIQETKEDTVSEDWRANYTTLEV